MPDRRHFLTPDALVMMDTIERTGSFAAAARELGKVPSALTYSVRQLEDALDVLLFDRRSRQARLTPAGEELLREGRRLLQQMDAVANRVQRVASGWEPQLTIAIDNIIAPDAIYDLVEAFYALKPPTRLKLRTEVLSGTWETLLSGQADLALGIPGDRVAGPGLRQDVIGRVHFVFTVAPGHPLANAPEPLPPTVLAQHRVIAVADTARQLEPVTVGILPGQDVLTLPTMSAKLEALLRGLGCGSLPAPFVQGHIDAGRLIAKRIDQPERVTLVHYAWRQQSSVPGHALAWWLQQLGSAKTREALLTLHRPSALHM
ncbi:LysR substrate-binding domain-containing protein [Aquabacterium sp.]|uniref:LysR substrate-binding domain-containing protein n=1 Tax=Aquabacterium sp. TaxID=1872578 RepID=UPI0035AE2D54